MGNLFNKSKLARLITNLSRPSLTKRYKLHQDVFIEQLKPVDSPAKVTPYTKLQTALLIEPLEPRILLNADISPWISTLSDGLDDVDDFLGDLEKSDTLELVLPVLGDNVSSLIDLSDLLTDTITEFKSVLADVEDFSAMENDALMALLADRLGASSAQYDDVTGISFSFDFAIGENITVPFSFTDAAFNVETSTQGQLALTLGIDFTADNPEDAFYVSFGEFDLSLIASEENLAVSVDVGGVSAEVSQGQFALDLSFNIDLVDPSGDGKWTLNELNEIGNNADLPGVTIAIDSSSLTANLPLSFTAGTFESNNLLEASLVADIDNLFDINTASFSLESNISEDLQDDITLALQLADDAISSTMPKLNDLLAEEVPGLGEDFSTLFGLESDFSFSIADSTISLSTIADDYFDGIADGAAATFSGLIDALTEALTEAGSSLIPVLDPQTLAINFSLSMDESVSFAPDSSFDTSNLGVSGLSGSADLQGDFTLQGAINFSVDLDSDNGIKVFVTQAEIGLDGELELTDIEVDFAFAGIVAGVTGAGNIILNSRLVASDTNANGQIDIDELLNVTPEGELNVHFELATNTVELGDLGQVSNVSLIVDGDLSLNDNDVSTDLTMLVDFSIPDALQNTLHNLMNDADSYLNLANEKIESGLGQLVPAVNKTIADILGLANGETLLPDISLVDITDEYFTSFGDNSTLQGLVDAISARLNEAKSALLVNFDPQSLSLSLGLSVDNLIDIESQALSSSSLALGDFGGSVSASGVFDLNGHIEVDLGLSMALIGDTGASMNVTALSVALDLEASIDDLNVSGDIAGIGGGIEHGEASLNITGVVSASDIDSDGTISIDEFGQLSREVSIGVDAVLPLITTGIDLLGDDGLISPTITLHADNVLGGLSSDKLSYFVDFTIGTGLDVGIAKLLSGLDVVIDSALDGIAIVLEKPMPGSNDSVGDSIGLTADQIREIDIDLDQVYATLKADKIAALSGISQDVESVNVTIHELMAAMNDAITAAIADASGSNVPVVIDGSEVSLFDGAFTVELDTENQALSFNVNIEQVLNTLTLDIDGSALNNDLDISIATEITPTLGLSMAAIMQLDDPLNVSVEQWSASVALNVDVQGKADGETANINIGPFGVEIVDGELDLAFSVSGQALSANEGQAIIDANQPATDIVIAGELSVGGILSGEFTPANYTGSYGILSVSEQGVWSYDITSNNVEGTKIDLFDLTNADGEQLNVAVTVMGANSLIFPTTNVNELSVSDTALLKIYEGEFGVFQVFEAADGTRDISYQLNSSSINTAINDSSVGATVTDSFTVFSDDNSSENIDVVITLPGKSSSSFEAPQGHGFIVQSDATMQYGTFSISTTGSWTYNVDETNSAVSSLSTGEFITDEVDVVRADGQHETITITLYGLLESETDSDKENHASGYELTFEAGFNGNIILDATIDGVGTAATLLFEVNADNLFGDSGVVSGELTQADTYADLAIDLSTIDFGYDIIIGADLNDWVVDKLITLDDILAEALANAGDILNTSVPGLDKKLGDILGMAADSNGDYTLDVPFTLTQIFQNYISLVDQSDELAFPTVGGLFDYIKDEINKAISFINIYFDAENFSFDFDARFAIEADLDATWGLDLAALAGDSIDIFDSANASASAHVSAEGALVFDLGFGLNFMPENGEPSVYFTEISTDAQLDITISALNAGISIGPFSAGIADGSINVAIDFSGDVIVDGNTDELMTFNEIATNGTIEFDLNAEFEAVLPVNLSLDDISTSGFAIPVFTLAGALSLTHDMGDVDGDGFDDDGNDDFDLDYSMGYAIDIEVQSGLQDAITALMDGLSSIINGAVGGVNDLLGQTIPGMNQTVGDILGIDISNLSLDLSSITNDYFSLFDLPDGEYEGGSPTLLGLLETLSIEIGKQALPDLLDAVQGYMEEVNDTTNGISHNFESLQTALTPYLGSGENASEALTALEALFDSAPNDISYSDIINLLSPVLANVVSLIPGVDDQGQLKVDLSFDFGFGASSSFDLSVDVLNTKLEDLGFDVDFSLNGQGSFSADVGIDFNLGLGLDLNDLANVEAYLYLPDVNDPMASLNANATISGLGFGVTALGLEAGVVGGSATLDLGLALILGDDASVNVDTGRLTFANSGNNITLDKSGSFLMTLPFQIGEDDGAGGTSFNLMSVTAQDDDLFTDGFVPSFDFSTFEMPSIIDILLNIDKRDLLFSGVDMVLGGLEEFLQTKFLDQLGNIPMLGDALKEDGNFITAVRNEFTTAVGLLANQTGFDLADALGLALNDTFDATGISNSADENNDGNSDPVIWVNIKYRDVDGNEHTISMAGGLYKFDGEFKDNVVGATADGDFDFAALFETDAAGDNAHGIEFHAFEVELDFHADLIQSLGLGAIDTVDLSFDLGLDFLTLTSDAVLDVDFDLDINIALGISDTKGLYIGYDESDPDASEFSLSLSAYLIGQDGNDASLSLELGFLGFDATDNGVDGHGSGVSGSFDINLQDANADGMIVWGELTGSESILDVTAELVASGDIHLSTDMPVGIPQISVDFVYDQAINWALGEGVDISPAHVQFNNLELDLGVFFSDILAPMLSTVQDAIEPIEPIIDILLAPVPVISDLAGEDVTMIDLAELAIAASGKGNIDLGLIESALKIAQLAIDIPTDAGTLIIDFGDFDLGYMGEGAPSSSEAIDGATRLNTSSGAISDTSNSSNSSNSTAKTDKASGFMSKLTGIEGLSVPLLTDPSSLLGLLTGEVVDLIVYDMPGLDFSFEYEKDFLIVPQFMIWGGFFGEVSLSADFSFGYDSYGISQFMDNGNPLEIVNGLFLSDNWTYDAQGLLTDNPEVTLDVAIGVRGFGGVPGLVELGVKGGLYGHIELDLQDPGFTADGETGVPDGKLRLDEVVNQLSHGPLCLFDISGSLEARLSAFFWLGVDLGFLGKVTVVDWEAELFSITILEFDIDCTPNPPVFAQYINGDGGDHDFNGLSTTQITDNSGNVEYLVMEPPGDEGTLYLNIGDRAGDRLHGDIADGDENMFLQQITLDGVEYIQVIYNGIPYSALDPNNDERSVKVLFRADQVTDIVANGGNGNDEILIDSTISSDITLTLLGGSGNDEILALGGGSAQIWGGIGDDLLIGGDAQHTIYGDEGNDSIDGGLGNDFLYGGDDNDAIMGGEGNDTIDGDSGNDRILGGLGDDTIKGGTGNDFIRGEAGIDSINAEGGDDTIFWMQGDGNDSSVLGGTGNDSFNITTSDVEDTITMQSIIANASVNDAVSFNVTNSENDASFVFNTIETVSLNAGNGADVIEVFDLYSTDIKNVFVDVGQFTGQETHTIGMVSTGDYLLDSDNNYVYELDENGDELKDESGQSIHVMEKISIDFGVAGSQSALNAIDNAIAQYGEVTGLTDRVIDASALDGDEDTVTIHGSSSDDTITITKDSNVVQGVVLNANLQKSNDATDTYNVRVIHGERFDSFNDTLIIDGGFGNDHINATGVSDFIDEATDLPTGSANTIALDLRGNQGHDTIIGSNYNDIIRGGLGNDTLTGGIGVDSFFDEGGYDTLIEQFDKDMTLFNNGFVVGELSGLTYGEIDFIAYQELGVEFDKFASKTLVGDVDAYAPGAEVEYFSDGIFENANITGGKGNNTLVIGDDNGEVTVAGQVFSGFIDWQGYVVLDNGSNVDPLLSEAPEYYVIRNSGNLTGTIEINDTGTKGTDELLVNLEQPRDILNPSNNDQSVYLSSDASYINPDDGDINGDTVGILGSILVYQGGTSIDENATGGVSSSSDLRDHATIYYTDQIQKVTIQTGVGDDFVSVEDSLVRTSIELGDGKDTISVGVVDQQKDASNINVVNSYTPGNRDMMVVYGGDGDDVFDIHYHQASLHLYGENDNDLFSVFSYLVDVSDENPANNADLSIVSGEGDDSLDDQTQPVDENNYDYLYSGELKIDGGAGIDSFALVGTDIGDEVIITSNFIAGMGHYIELANIETIVIRTLGGDDTISIYSLPENVQLIINTGDDNDTINFGGNHEAVKAAPPVYNQPTIAGVDVGHSVGEWTASKADSYGFGGLLWSFTQSNYDFEQEVFDDYTLVPVADRVTDKPPEYWIWLGQDYDMSDILGDVIIEGDSGASDTVNLFNSESQVSDGRLTSIQAADNEPYGIELTGFSQGSITVSEVFDLNIYLGDENDTVTFELNEGSPLVKETTLFTGAGDDTVYVNAIRGLTNVYSGAGNDVIHVGDEVADHIGDTLVIDTDRDYAITQEMLKAPDGSAVELQVMQLTAGGIKEVIQVQLTDQPGWFIDTATGSMFYVPIESGTLHKATDDGSLSYYVPEDLMSNVLPSDVNPIYFELEGTHTLELTSLWVSNESPTGYHNDLRSGYTTSTGEFFENKETMTLWYMEQSLNNTLDGDIEDWSFVYSALFGFNPDTLLLSTINHVGTTFHLPWDNYLASMGKTNDYSQTYYYKAVGTGNSDGLYFNGVMDNQALVVDQALTSATSVSYDVINGNVQVSGNDSIIIHDQDDSINNTGTLTEDALYGLGMTGHVEYTGVEQFTVELGSGDDSFNIVGTHVNTITTVNGNNGDDVLNVSGAISEAIGHRAPEIAQEHFGSLDAIEGTLFLDAGANFNTVIFDDGADDNADNNILVFEDHITGLAPADIYYTATNGSFESIAGENGEAPEHRVRLYAGIAGNTITVDSTRNQVNEYTVINSGYGNDLVNVLETDVTHLIINAESGDDIVDASASNGNEFGLFIHGNSGNDQLIGGMSSDVIIGDSGDDVISANAGNDTVFGDQATISWQGLTATGVQYLPTNNDGQDRISGGAGNDLIRGQGGNDYIYGNTGNDIIAGDLGDDYIEGNDGSDIIFGDQIEVTWQGLSAIGVQYLASGSDGQDKILGGAGNDIIRGQGNKDFIWGNEGEDVISGDNDDDVIYGNLGDDTIFGDTALFTWSGLELVLSVDEENLADGNDIIEGNQGNDVIYGAGGDDNIMGGSSLLGAQDGNDHIDGGSGRDLIAGDNAIMSNQALAGLFSVDSRFASLALGSLVYDENGNPELSSTQFSDPSGHNSRYINLLDGNGNDVIAGGADDDWIFAQEGDDTVEGDSHLYADVIANSVSVDDRAGVNRDGNDYIEGGAGDDLIYGNLGQDDIVGGSSTLFGADTLNERADGADTLFGGSGTYAARYSDGLTGVDAHSTDADVIVGDNGTIYRVVNDITASSLNFEHDLSQGEKILVRAIVSDDYTIGGANTDIGGADIIHGEGSDDIIYGLTGADILYGDGQNDDIIGGMGADIIFGGNGLDGIIGDDGQLLTQIASQGSVLFSLEATAADQHYNINGDKLGVDGNASGDIVKVAILYSTSVGDDDVIFGGLGGDFIHSGGGNDTVSGAEALAQYFAPDNAVLLASATYDDLTRKLSFYDAENPMQKNDTIITNFESFDELGNFIDDGDDRIFGDDGHDWLVGGTGEDWLFGGRGDDVMNVDDDLDSNNTQGDEGNLGGRDIAYGGAGLDVLIGNSHNDQLIDWYGEFNSFIVPFKQFGAPTVLRMPSPSVIAYIEALGVEAGVDTRYQEPFGELGLFDQHDSDSRDNTGAPRDPQPGNNAGGQSTNGKTSLLDPVDEELYFHEKFDKNSHKSKK